LSTPQIINNEKLSLITVYRHSPIKPGDDKT